TIRWHFLQQAHDDVTQRTMTQRRKIRLGESDFVDQRKRTEVIVIRLLACDQLVHHHTNRIEVRGYTDGRIGEYFGSHVAYCACREAPLFEMFSRNGESKIQHPDMIIDNHHIVRLEVAVDYATPVQVS